MTTAAAPSIAWIRLTLDGVDFTLAPSPGIELRLAVNPVEYDGYLDPLVRGPLPELHVVVDLLPRNAASVIRCETQAREVAARLDLGSPVMREFGLEAALDGKGLPHNRMEAPRLLLVPDGPPTLDDDGSEPFVRVFTAKVPSGSESAYTLRLVD
jgi:hypothetical protein